MLKSNDPTPASMKLHRLSNCKLKQDSSLGHFLASFLSDVGNTFSLQMNLQIRGDLLDEIEMTDHQLTCPPAETDCYYLQLDTSDCPVPIMITITSSSAFREVPGQHPVASKKENSSE